MQPDWINHLPTDIDPDQVVARVGLISDTHMPDRLAQLPDAIFEVMRGVNLVLHAGDVGELWVLDLLSSIAPVVAVHGNDDTEDAQRELPYQQVVTIRGTRIFVCHSHYPEREEEMASRRFDEWGPKLDRLFGLGAGARAQVIVYGHSHIPMALERDGVLLTNPGAIASGGAVNRQLVRSIALLFILRDAHPRVVHIDLAQPDRVYSPQIDWEAGFRAAQRRYSASILAPDLQAQWPEFDAAWREWFVNPDNRPHALSLYRAVVAVAHRCWADEQEMITRDDLFAAIRRAEVPGEVKAAAESVLRG